MSGWRKRQIADKVEADMNDRIQELMPKPWTFPYPDRELYTKEQFGKFAELIIRECIDTVLDSSVEYATRPQIAEELKEHFGIE
jgi:hypothetical protein